MWLGHHQAPPRPPDAPTSQLCPGLQSPLPPLLAWKACPFCSNQAIYRFGGPEYPSCPHRQLSTWLGPPLPPCVPAETQPVRIPVGFTLKTAPRTPFLRSCPESPPTASVLSGHLPRPEQGPSARPAAHCPQDSSLLTHRPLPTGLCSAHPTNLPRVPSHASRPSCCGDGWPPPRGMHSVGLDFQGRGHRESNTGHDRPRRSLRHNARTTAGRELQTPDDHTRACFFLMTLGDNQKHLMTCQQLPKPVWFADGRCKGDRQLWG